MENIGNALKCCSMSNFHLQKRKVGPIYNVCTTYSPCVKRISDMSLAYLRMRLKDIHYSFVFHMDVFSGSQIRHTGTYEKHKAMYVKICWTNIQHTCNVSQHMPDRSLMCSHTPKVLCMHKTFFGTTYCAPYEKVSSHGTLTVYYLCLPYL